MRIERFRGKAAFLSNFARCQIFYCGAWYPSVEHAYQAMKTDNVAVRYEIAKLDNPGDAKKWGQKLPLRTDWEDVKLVIMEDLLRLKFQCPPYRRLLLETGDATIVEGNTWNDTFWGQCPIGTGENHLGRLLMQIREDIREERRAFHTHTANRLKEGNHED